MAANRWDSSILNWPTRRQFSEMSQPQRLAFYIQHLIPTPSGCLEWPGARRDGGYGVLSWDRRIVRATRLLWVQWHGEIQAGLFVCHSCDNPACVNPAHLFLGSAGDNHQDARSKGRTVAPPVHLGLANCNGKLSPADVESICAEYRTGFVGVRCLGSKYGVNKSTVQRHLKKAGLL